jgi:DNA processing protein
MKVERVVRRGDRQYPALFALWDEAPTVLYCAGDVSLLNAACIAVIGTREPTEAGRKTAFNLARALAAVPGVVILSGLALGCDTQAHLGALAAKGKTLAVFGTPLAQVYPPENRDLAEQIVQGGGLIVSCYEKPARDKGESKRRFIERDQVQAALSMGVIPIQGSMTSGTRHAVEWAWEHDRVIAVPRPIVADQAAHPDQYTLIEKYIKIGVSGAIHVIEGKASYPELLASLGIKARETEPVQ